MIEQVGAVNSFTGAQAAEGKKVNKKAVVAGTIAGVAALATAAYFTPKALDKFVKNLSGDMAEAKWYQKAIKFVHDKTEIFSKFVNDKAKVVKDFTVKLFEKVKNSFKKAPDAVKNDIPK